MTPSNRNRVAKFSAEPRLIFAANTLDDARLPRVDAHIHTKWTDGAGTVNEVYRAAIENRLEVIQFSEHSRKTSIDWYPRFAAEVRSLPSDPCKAYVGTECKVETCDGEIDTIPDIVNLCDFVTASVHRFPDQSGKAIPFSDVKPEKAIEIEYGLTWAVLANPMVDILGHMFGMCYKRFNVIPPDNGIRSLIGRAAKFGVAIEVNSRYHTNVEKMIRWCREFDAMITFGSDAHTLEEVGSNLRFQKHG